MNIYRPSLAVIEKINQETRDTRTFTLRFLDDDIREKYKFSPGQFNMVSIFGVGEAPFSITSDPEAEGIFEHTIRMVGSVTNAIFKLREGDIVGVRGPFGKGWPLDEAKGKDLLIVAGGIGIAPLRPVIYYTIKHRDEFNKVEVLYGARTPGDLLYVDEYDRWTQAKNFRLLLTVDAVPKGVKWDHRVGVVTKLFEDMETKPDNSIVFICGPEIMMKFAVKGLLERGFNKRQIYLSMERRMKCGVGKCGHCQIGSKYVCKDGPVFSYDEVEPLPDKIV